MSDIEYVQRLRAVAAIARRYARGHHTQCRLDMRYDRDKNCSCGYTNLMMVLDDLERDPPEVVI